MEVIFLKDYNDNNVRREIIMEHYSKPKNKEIIEKADLSNFSNHCVDELHIKWEFDNNRVKTAKWDGIGCAVFQSSADIFIDMIKDMPKEKVIELANAYEDLINQRDSGDEQLLGDLMVFKNVKSQLNRLNCANMVSQAIIKELT